MRVVLWGDSQHRLFLSVLEQLIQMKEIDLVGVIISPADKVRRGWQRPVLSWKDAVRRAARRLKGKMSRSVPAIANRWAHLQQSLTQRGVLLLAPPAELLRTQGFADTLQGLQPDLLLFVVYTEYVPEEIFGSVPNAINIHPSLLPKYRGSHPLVWALWNGEDVVGVTAFKMHHKLDAGDIVSRRSIPTENRSYSDLNADIERQVVSVAEEVLHKALAGKIDAQPQDESLATTFMVPKEADYRADFVNWSWRRFVRMDEISKGALWTVVEGHRLALSQITKVDGVVGGVPGTVVDVSKAGLMIHVSDAVICIKSLESGIVFSTRAEQVAKAIGIKAGMPIGGR